MNSRFMITPTAVLPSGSVMIAYFRDNGAHNPKNSREEQQRIIMDYCRKHDLVLSKVHFEPTGGLNGKRNRFFDSYTLFVDGLPVHVLGFNPLDTLKCSRVQCRGVLIHTEIPR